MTYSPYNISHFSDFAKEKQNFLQYFLEFGHHKPGEVRQMKLTGFAVTMGLGAAAGAVAILMMPRQNPTRQLANKAAIRVEDAVMDAATKLTQ